MTEFPVLPSDVPWHVSPGSLARYARGEAAPGQAASIEPHLANCTDCQADMASLMMAPERLMNQRLATVLDDVIESADGPRPRLLERLLLRVGVPDHIARVLVASPQMELPWLAAILATLVFTVVATRSGSVGFGFFLVVAPLLPLALVEATFRLAGADIAELTITAPIRASWLLLLRSVSVIVPAFFLCGVAAIALPNNGWENAAWVLPALALSSMAAAASTWIHPTAAALSLMAGWLGVVAFTTGPLARSLRSIDPGAVLEHGPVFAPAGQLVALALTTVSLFVLLQRREVLDTRSPA